ncbi:MAG: Rieske 2Fe-2S domain-containing protein [Acidimicrobiales bacterium]
MPDQPRTTESASTEPASAALGTSLDPRTLPQFQVAASDPDMMGKAVAACFFVALVAFAGFGAAYTENFDNFWLGVTLGVGFAGLGAGMVAWGKYLMPRGPFQEPRHRLGPTEEEREEFIADFAARGKVAIERRGFLVKLVGAASAVFGIVAVFPLLRSLGPLPKKLFYNTAWRRGSYVTRVDGSAVHVDDLDKGGILTVFPDKGGAGKDVAMSQTLLIRLQSSGSIVTAPGRESWGPDGYVAFSKVCTHAGCPVSLFEQATSQLLCPCHQSVFDIGQGEPAIPVFGPAPRPLPQLPLSVDPRGFLRAQAGYDEPVGPGFWERGND